MKYKVFGLEALPGSFVSVFSCSERKKSVCVSAINTECPNLWVVTQIWVAKLSGSQSHDFHDLTKCVFIFTSLNH